MPLKELREIKGGAELGIWKLTESVSELESLMSVEVASEKYKGFNHDLRRLEWLGARALMSQMGLKKTLQYTEHGKPFYPAGPKISISHSKDFIAIITHPENEVGIDVQEIVGKVSIIKHKFCNTNELDWATSDKDFTIIWSAKEAVFKVKERNVLFKEHIQVNRPENGQLQITFKESQVYSGVLLNLKNYEGVYVVEGFS
ncbi:MAG TPA: hypothetical protein DHU89_01095 [Flavobacteriales bacterium]|nr:hypothetical protein [Flavobacteriales bacterium]|tara:strand:- start:2228 stop:2830 length:603 start_codon:yes stop_codon:yes gene_type:complete